MPEAFHLPTVKPASLSMSTPEEISITCYENQVPPFVEAELERLYPSLFSSFAAFKVYGHLGNVSTYVVYKGEVITGVWLFRGEKNAVRVVNEMIQVNTEDVSRFATYIFTVYRSVNVISFHAVETRIRRLPFPHQRYNCSDDIVLSMPGTVEEYFAGLGKATRKNINRYLKKLKQRFPSFRYTIYVKDEVSEQHVRDIISLNRARMACKGKVSGIDEEEERRLIQLAKLCGFVGVATVNGQVVAGVVAYRFQDNYFSYVRAHDPGYNDYRLGIVGAYLLICECILRNGKELHFMWGREQHKLLLNGKMRDLDHLTVYRSSAQFLMNADMVLKNMLSGYYRQAKLRFLDSAKQDDDITARLANKLLKALRCMKRWKHNR